MTTHSSTQATAVRTTSGWESLTRWVIIVAVAQAVVVVVSASFGLFLNLHHQTIAVGQPHRSVGHAIDLAVALVFYAYLVVRRIWFVRTRTLLTRSSVDPAPVLNNGWMRGWRYAIFTWLAVGLLDVALLHAYPNAHFRVPVALALFALALVSSAIAVVLVKAVLVTRSGMRGPVAQAGV